MARKYNYKIVAWLYNAGYTQKEVGYMLGISPSYVGKILGAEGVVTRGSQKEKLRTLFENFPEVVRGFMSQEELQRAMKVSNFYKQKYLQNNRKIDEDIHMDAVNLLKDWVENTVIGKLKPTKIRFHIKRSETTMAHVSTYVTYENSQKVFDWYDEEECTEECTLVVDEQNCGKFRAVKNYGKYQEKRWNEMGKNARATYEIESVGGEVSLSVELRVN
ncbi:hypothetical protein CN495_07755 [Bacillus thuringiensis]|uniref:Helix-turn-helix domain-containing protein n=1 Tax=Bacillus thuringiensis TaxID=1428 RepID=A0ABD6SGJ0_BACTU|nr:hypothetical protein [Bacillus thuringiensis]PER55639.1 hypothetical protein CN495_07755 [Bacillus thuringiensis]